MSKTIFITGSTGGIGKLAAIKLAKDEHTLLVHGRSHEKVDSTVSEIKSLTGNPNINGYVADLSNLDEVKQMADQIKNDISEIDVLINNAGVYKSPEQFNKDGLDLRFVVNYLAPYLLTDLLNPVLRKGIEPRIINVGSAAQSPVSLEALTGETKTSTGETYAQSKLALTMWSFHLAATEPDLEVIAVNPGSLLNTRMVQEAFGNYWSPADKGGNILYDLAVSENYKGSSGRYFDNDKGTFSKAHPDAYNKSKIKNLISETEQILKVARSKP